MCKITAKMHILYISFPIYLMASIPTSSLLPCMRTDLEEVNPIQHGSQWRVGKGACPNHLGNIFGSFPQSQQSAKNVPPHRLVEVLSAGEHPKHILSFRKHSWDTFLEAKYHYPLTTNQMTHNPQAEYQSFTVHSQLCMPIWSRCISDIHK